MVPGCPSVEIHRLPFESNARLSGHAIGRDLLPRVSGKVGAGVLGRVPGHQQDVPGELGRRGIVVAFGEFDDVPVAVAGARVRLVGECLASGAALGVVGQRNVKLAGHRARLHVLGTVHLGCPGLVRGEPGVDKDFLNAHAGNHGTAVFHQRDPLPAAVKLPVAWQSARTVNLSGRGIPGEPCHVQVALGEQAHVVAAIPAPVLFLEMNLYT